MALTIQHIIKTKNGHVLKTLTPRKAIRERCLDCSGWNAAEVRKCPVRDCPLWPYRAGYGKPETLSCQNFDASLGKN